MNAKRADTLSTRFLIAGLVVLLIKVTLGLIGVDLLDMPLGVASITLLMLCSQWSGWAKGYREAKL